MRGKTTRFLSAALVLSMTGVMALSGCSGSSSSDGVTEIEILQYKPEAATYFDQVEEEFNAAHDDIHLTIDSPNDASTIMRTRFIREEYPDIIGIGGDINYSYYVDAEILADVSDYEGMENIKDSYIDIAEALEIVPTDGTYIVPYVANAAGVLYNKDMFEEHGWEIPTTWDELMSLCEEIQSEGILPFYFGFRDTWTCLAPWNSIAVDLAPADLCRQVNRGEANFTDEYREAAEKYLELMDYGPDDPIAYGYNDACTAFARGESAMYPIGSYAVPQILSVNPDMNIDSFVMPASDDPDGNTLNSGIDLGFCVTEACENKEAAWEFLKYAATDGQIPFCSTGGYVPGYNALVDNEEILAGNELLSKPGFIKALENTIPRPSSSKYSELTDALQISIHKYLSNEGDLAGTVAEVESLLEEYK